MGITWIISIRIMLYFFLSLIALTAALPSRPIPTTQSNRIVNGEDVADTSVAPWQVSLQRFGSHFCGGSLIGPHHVMSACHCNVGTPTVVMGTIDYTAPKVATKGRFQCHPNYDENVIDYDYSVITLDDHVDEDSDIQFIELATKEYPAGTAAQITGWGKTAAISMIPKIMQVAQTVLVSQNECASIWGTEIPITSRMQCAGGQGINSGCQGDSGGPLAVNDNGTWKLVGNTSWGSSTCKVSMPSAWSKNSEVHSWIVANVDYHPEH